MSRPGPWGILLVVLFLSASRPADASPFTPFSLVVGPDGILTGATGVVVDGRSYDVDFIDGTCSAVFGGCDVANFVFSTESSALSASRALLDQVLLDTVGLGDFDSNPMLTRGCYFEPNCWILTPYAVMGDNFLITQTHNGASFGSPDGYFVHTPGGPGISILGYDGSLDINGVLAKWSEAPAEPPVAHVPEPSSLMLVGMGCIGLLGRARLRRQRRNGVA